MLIEISLADGAGPYPSMLRQEARAAVQAVAEHRPRIDNGDRRIIHGDDGKETAVNPNPGRQSPAPRPHVDRILGAGPFSFLQNLARCQTDRKSTRLNSSH